MTITHKLSSIDKTSMSLATISATVRTWSTSSPRVGEGGRCRSRPPARRPRMTARREKARPRLEVGGALRLSGADGAGGGPLPYLAAELAFAAGDAVLGRRWTWTSLSDPPIYLCGRDDPAQRLFGSICPMRVRPQEGTPVPPVGRFLPQPSAAHRAVLSGGGAAGAVAVRAAAGIVFQPRRDGARCCRASDLHVHVLAPDVSLHPAQRRAVDAGRWRCSFTSSFLSWPGRRRKSPRSRWAQWRWWAGPGGCAWRALPRTRGCSSIRCPPIWMSTLWACWARWHICACEGAGARLTAARRRLAGWACAAVFVGCLAAVTAILRAQSAAGAGRAACASSLPDGDAPADDAGADGRDAFGGLHATAAPKTSGQPADALSLRHFDEPLYLAISFWPCRCVWPGFRTPIPCTRTPRASRRIRFCATA